MAEISKDLQQYKTYSLAELEPIVGLSSQTLIRHIKAGKLEAKKIGRSWRVTEDALKKFLAK